MEYLIIIVTACLTSLLLYYVMDNEVGDNIAALPLGMAVVLVVANLLVDNTILCCLLIGVAAPVCLVFFYYIIAGVVMYIMEKIER